METVLVHKMDAGLGEIFASWLSLINIAIKQKQKGHKVLLIIDCSKSKKRYLNARTIQLFFDFDKLNNYFDVITVTDDETVHDFTNVFPNFENPQFGVITDDSSDIEYYFELNANRIVNTNTDGIIYPNLVTMLVSTYYDNFVKSNNINVNNVHHIRVIDGYERIDEAKPIADLVIPNLKDGDLVLSSSNAIKKVIKDNSDKQTIEYENPIEDTLSNHFTFHGEYLPDDLMFMKTLMAYIEMRLIGESKHFYRYSVYRDYWSAFLLFGAINKVESTYTLIPREYIDGPWIKDYCSDVDWLRALEERNRGRFFDSPRANFKKLQ